MSSQLKTILLTVLTLSAFMIALVELSGVSSTALFNKYNIGVGSHAANSENNSGTKLGETDAEQRQERAMAMPKTILTFDETKFDFGKIKAGDVVKHSFHFRNTGTAPLLISKADVSCGCTVPSFPKEPIAPGQADEIIVQFNSHGKTGHQEKNVIIYSNGQIPKMSIGFTAEVE
ncbi:MAG: DUF1573 domain-containing protein [Chitinophagaceae bacterium]